MPTKSHIKDRSLDLGTLLLTIQRLTRRDFAIVHQKLLILANDKLSGLLVDSQPIATPPLLERLRQESLSKFLMGRNIIALRVKQNVRGNEKSVLRV